MTKQRDTAAAQLQRILYLLAAAGAEQGAALAALAEALGITSNEVVRDLTVLAERDYYHRAGAALEARLWISAEHAQVYTPGAFQRPPRLSHAEAAALALGLRALGHDAAPERAAHLRELAERIVNALALPAAGGAGDAAPIGAPGSDAAAGEPYAQLRRAAREHRWCRIEYLKDGGVAEERFVAPYAIVHAERWRYALAYCEERQAVRAFRVDRVLDAELLLPRFTVPDDFRLEDYVRGGRLFAAPAAVPVRVRYSARIARWIRERYGDAATAEADGSVVVEHPVADPAWLVRQVLQYGRDAEVLGPAEYRDHVRGALERRLAASAQLAVAG